MRVSGFLQARRIDRHSLCQIFSLSVLCVAEVETHRCAGEGYDHLNGTIFSFLQRLLKDACLQTDICHIVRSVTTEKKRNYIKCSSDYTPDTENKTLQ